MAGSVPGLVRHSSKSDGGSQILKAQPLAGLFHDTATRRRGEGETPDAETRGRGDTEERLEGTRRRKFSGTGREYSLMNFLRVHQINYDISLLVSFFGICVSLGSLFKRIASINDRFYLPRLNKLLEEN